MEVSDGSEEHDFVQRWGLGDETVTLLQSLPFGVKNMVLQKFDGSGTKDGNVLGRLKGYIAVQLKRSGAGPLPGHANDVAAFADRWGLSHDVVNQLLQDAPLDVQETVLQNFDGSQTKDGNVLGRLQGYIATLLSRKGISPGIMTRPSEVAQFAERWGLSHDVVNQVLRDLPLDIQETVLHNFDGSKTKDGNVMSRLQGYIATLSRRKGVQPTLQAVPLMNMAQPMRQMLVPHQYFVMPPQPHQRPMVFHGPQGSGTPSDETQFVSRWNLGEDALRLMQNLPLTVKQHVINNFDGSGTKDGNVLGRLQGYIASQLRRHGMDSVWALPSQSVGSELSPTDFAERWGIDTDSVEKLFSSIPPNVQKTVLQNFDGNTTKDGNVLGRLQGYVSSLMRKPSPNVGMVQGNGPFYQFGQQVQQPTSMPFGPGYLTGLHTSGVGNVPVGAFTGQVKSFDTEKGWGFIACEASHQMYGMDIFLRSQSLGGYVPEVGDELRFAVTVGFDGFPEATSVSFKRGGYMQQSAGSVWALPTQYQSAQVMPPRGTRCVPY
eukprot:TRINITY_DN25865_c0_g2_i1.p1 TRINITY_DN25865_c0_g2~~TRINITY_DN25865_c0_g2_i1.p1  ORF type:complete len:546 (+),score=77.91 TRINITY_DN25865_c0_g2_i1:114-1751(+)